MFTGCHSGKFLEFLVLDKIRKSKKVIVNFVLFTKYYYWMSRRIYITGDMDYVILNIL